MQSIAARQYSLRLLLPSSRTCLLPIARASTTPTNPSAVDVDAATSEADKQSTKHEETHQPEPVVIKTPPFASSKLESTHVSPNATPTFQQKRHLATALDIDVACVGADGRPLIDTGEDWSFEEAEKTETVEDNREYYEHRKASPLSEIKMEDTRLPITKAIDEEKKVDDGEGQGYLIEDTVDDALKRAEEMFNAARERGDPTWPHSRALMRMLRERYGQLPEMGGDQYGTWQQYLFD